MDLQTVTMLYINDTSHSCNQNSFINNYCLSRNLKLFSFDLFCHGKSDGYDANYEVFLLTEHLKQTIEVLIYARENFFKDDKIILSGEGFGAQICLLIMRDYQFMKRINVDAILLHNTTVDCESTGRFLYHNILTDQDKIDLQLQGNLYKFYNNERFHLNREYIRDIIEKCTFLCKEQKKLHYNLP